MNRIELKSKIGQSGRGRTDPCHQWTPPSLTRVETQSSRPSLCVSHFQQVMNALTRTLDTKHRSVSVQVYRILRAVQWQDTRICEARRLCKGKHQVSEESFTYTECFHHYIPTDFHDFHQGSGVGVGKNIPTPNSSKNL